MFNSDTFANRPSFGIVGRIFISTDTAAIFRDTGTAWNLIANASVSTNIYNSDGTLSANRTVSSGGFNLTINPSTTFATTLTAAVGLGSVSAFGVNTLSYPAAFSSSNLGNVYGAIGGFNLQTFAGSATFSNANIAAANTSINSVDFSSGGSTITMTQASGLRVMAGHINMFQYQGTNSGTINHAAVSQNLGFYRPTGATGTLTITNGYGHLINDLTEYGAGFSFTDRYGLYQAGTSDVNYFAGRTLIGTTVNAGFKLDVFGTVRLYPRGTINGGFEFTNVDVYNILHSPTLTNISAGDYLFIGGTGLTMLGINKNDTIGQVTIGYASYQSSSVSNSAILDIRSATKGFLPPRMTTSEKNAISSPAAGLIVYDSTLNKLCLRTASAWETITSV